MHKLFKLLFSVHGIINMLGLATAFTACILIMLWVLDELSYNQFDTNNQLEAYEVLTSFEFSSENIETMNRAPLPLRQIVKEEYPEVKNTVTSSIPKALTITTENSNIQEYGIFASSEFFNVFEYQIIKGIKKEQLLINNNSIVISDKLASKLYGDNWQTLDYSNQTIIINEKIYSISGIFHYLDKTTYSFHVVLPLLNDLNTRATSNAWENFDYHLYITLDKSIHLNTFNGKIREINNKHWQEAQGHVFAHVQSFSRQYLYSEFENGVNVGGRIKSVQTFAIIALIIMLFACINFTNLSVAKSLHKAKQVVIHKVIGASKRRLYFNYFTESLQITLFSSLFSFGMIVILLPVFNGILNKDLSFQDLTLLHLIVVIAAILCVSLVSSIYPSILVNTFNTVSVLKGKFRPGSRTKLIRQGLILFQFTFSLVMIMGTVIISKQLKFVLDKDLGLTKEDVVIITPPSDLNNSIKTAWINSLYQNTQIKEVSQASSNPISIAASVSGVIWEGRVEQSNEVLFKYIYVDENFIELLDLTLIEGRNFEKNRAVDRNNYIVNETALKAMSMTDPLGKTIEVFGNAGEIVGVLKDFHMESLHHDISPLIMGMGESKSSSILVKLNSDHSSSISELNPQQSDANFDFKFLEESYLENYKGDLSAIKLISFFTIVSIVISSLGIFGLTSIDSQQYLKELSIRKILGANITSLIFRMSKTTISLIMVAFLIASPIAYYFMNQWLNDFKYATTLNGTEFFIAGIIGFTVISLSSAIKLIHLVRKNPINAIRSE